MFAKSLLFFALAMAACSPAPASQVADNTPADEGFEFAGHHPHRGHHVPQRIQRFDANHDGVLEANEVPPRLKTWFGEVDANHDGLVTAHEIREYNRTHHPHGQHHGQPQQTSVAI